MDQSRVGQLSWRDIERKVKRARKKLSKALQKLRDNLDQIGIIDALEAYGRSYLFGQFAEFLIAEGIVGADFPTEKLLELGVTPRQGESAGDFYERLAVAAEDYDQNKGASDWSGMATVAAVAVAIFIIFGGLKR